MTCRKLIVALHLLRFKFLKKVVTFKPGVKITVYLIIGLPMVSLTRRLTSICEFWIRSPLPRCLPSERNAAAGHLLPRRRRSVSSPASSRSCRSGIHGAHEEAIAAAARRSGAARRVDACRSATDGATAPRQRRLLRPEAAGAMAADADVLAAAQVLCSSRPSVVGHDATAPALYSPSSPRRTMP